MRLYLLGYHQVSLFLILSAFLEQVKYKCLHLKTIT